MKTLYRNIIRMMSVLGAAIIAIKKYDKQGVDICKH